MSGYGMNRPPDEDSESESSHHENKPYISFSEGNDPSRPGDHNNPSMGLAGYDAGQAGGSTPGGQDASGSEFFVIHMFLDIMTDQKHFSFSLCSQNLCVSLVSSNIHSIFIPSTTHGSSFPRSRKI